MTITFKIGTFPSPPGRAPFFLGTSPVPWAGSFVARLDRLRSH